MQTAFTHIAKQVRDLDASINFYRDYCNLIVVHDRGNDETGHRVVWLAEQGKADTFVFVLIPGKGPLQQVEKDYSHLGFALPSRAAVDAVADRARQEGILVWPPRQEPFPVGYYCGICDPDGQMVEFSFGQPLGPGAERPA